VSTGNPAAGSAPAGSPVTAVQVAGRLAEPEVAAVLGLVERAATEDKVGPLSEHVLLHLRYGGDPQARNVLLWGGDLLAGYGHLDPATEAAGPSGEMLIRPELRRQGLGLQLARALIARAGERELRLWAHGDLPGAVALATAAGFERTRSLWRMRRSLRDPFAEPKLAEGIEVRTFRVGQDEAAWTALNAVAFAQHPEQGAWTQDDLDLREREPWFDPAGFFLAQRDGRIVGFHWTKVADGVGEVYVVGVDPAERGTGLGRALTLIGLRYLRDRELAEVTLYVDEENTPAIRLYESLGFAHVGTDVMFTHAPGRTSPTTAVA
jgi:mycothiol synthase